MNVQHRGVEDAERRHDHLVMLVGRRPRDQRLEFLIGHDLVHLQTKIAEGRDEVILLAPRLDVVGVGESEIERADQIRILMDDLEDVLGREGLGAQATLDLGQDLSMYAVAGIQDRRERCVLGACNR